MDIFTAIEERRAVKSYDTDYVIPQGDVDKLIKQVQLCPTSFNIQHLRLVHVTDADTRQQIRAAAWDQAQVTEASLLFVLCADVKAWQKEPARYWRNTPEATKDMMVSMIAQFYEGREDVQRDEALRTVGIAAQTLMLSAKAMGYDSGPMIGFDSDSVAKIINLPEDHIIGMLLVVGKAAKPAHPRGGSIEKSEMYIENKF